MALALGGVVVVAFGVGGCADAEAEGAVVERKAFAFNGETLTIEAGDSAVDIVPADVRSVEVERRVDGWVFLGEGPEPVWELRDGTLELGVSCEAVASDCEARHAVKVPRGVAVTVRGDNGDVTASGFDTALALRSDNGRVTVRDSSGPLELVSDNGEIVGERITAKAVSADSDNGEVRLGFAVVPDLVDSSSANGETVIELPGSGAYRVTASAGNGSAKVDVREDPQSRHVIKARSDNGDIVVRGTT
ncbi:DUF4097 family beta strand repeat-containing protein [Streptomyces formicae]|uniref:DUF4097 family beta strand repeat protein n=1 Tax=Streptomyces formicae TaxID=1616117 RepID=A0ABY3WTT5_9ACTN|nr:DUF4097 family beta strand repeat-containing protein [Streptomyces formicae]UNM14889.1 DUF4097 family beta strand repeat protein [Streptomyces formicae]